jgi:Tfp pilus assembly protein PilN
VTRANEILRRISLPWQDLFHAVESAAPKDVALLAMEPDPDKQLLKIAGEAKDVAAMLEYVRSLEGRPIFRSVTLSNHQVQQQDPQRPIRFSLVAAWKDLP